MLSVNLKEGGAEDFSKKKIENWNWKRNW